MNAEAVLKHRVRNEQTSGGKKSPSKGVIIYYFFPAHLQIFRPIGHTFGSRRERVKKRLAHVLLKTRVGPWDYLWLAKLIDKAFDENIYPVQCKLYNRLYSSHRRYNIL